MASALPYGVRAAPVQLSAVCRTTVGTSFGIRSVSGSPDGTEVLAPRSAGALVSTSAVTTV
ncbi:hypothetical protein QDR37_08565 [Amnibacterium sp. CER49]|uniref:hypothetical protein n=1 Tax=Amnibacterium sp. CER49 TaxID=3039161 RepID=UPI00244CFB1E|nr:hypothetical protein [Amnibacterium sp. CER49]MDH2443994.1 hypothetical protein [Amnibacterium sp. CER49]